MAKKTTYIASRAFAVADEGWNRMAEDHMRDSVRRWPGFRKVSVEDQANYPWCSNVSHAGFWVTGEGAAFKKRAELEGFRVVKIA